MGRGGGDERAGGFRGRRDRPRDRVLRRRLVDPVRRHARPVPPRGRLAQRPVLRVRHHQTAVRRCPGPTRVRARPRPGSPGGAGIGPSGHRGHQPRPAAAVDGRAPPDEDADPSAARRLLEEAGYATGAELGTIVVNASGLAVGPAVAVWREELGSTSRSRPWTSATISPSCPSARLPCSRSTGSPTTPHRTPSTGSCCFRTRPRTTALERPDLRRSHGSRGAGDRSGRAAIGVPRGRGRGRRRSAGHPWSWDASHWLVRDGLNGVGTLTVGLLDFGRVSWAD